MSYLGWMVVVGAVLLFMGLTSAYLRQLPVTSAGIYLALGFALSPGWLDVISVDFVGRSALFERLTETAVIVSLFVGGLKLRLPLRHNAWRPAYLLAGPVMLASILGVAVFAHYILGIAWPAAFLLGAVLAPTDPVLASEVAVNDAVDRDRVRYGLSGEAGLNDGTAFPFVVFALLWLEAGSIETDWVVGWALHRLIWAVPAGLLLGFYLGIGLGRLAIWLRSRYRETNAPNDFLALALIALAYAGAEAIHAWGFLAAFAAGVGFRRAEIKTSIENPLSGPETRPEALQHNDAVPETAEAEETGLPPAEDVASASNGRGPEHPTVAAGVVVSDILSFGETAERLFEVMMVVLIGISLAYYWDWRAVPLALAVFFVIRPLAVYIFLLRTRTNRLQRSMMAWFGIRGIGSLYYLSYAIEHGLPARFFSETAGLVVSVVALSILIHGLSGQPILDLYERKIAESGGGTD